MLIYDADFIDLHENNLTPINNYRGVWEGWDTSKEPHVKRAIIDRQTSQVLDTFYKTSKLKDIESIGNYMISMFTIKEKD